MGDDAGYGEVIGELKGRQRLEDKGKEEKGRKERELAGRLEDREEAENGGEGNGREVRRQGRGRERKRRRK